MPITYPLPVRVAAGLLVSGVDLAKRLPAELPSMAVTAAGQAMRLSMKVQQNIAELAIRGDEALSLIGGAPPENPSWATFDDDVPSAAPSAGAGAKIEDGVAGSNGVVTPDFEDPDSAQSVVDLPSRSRRRASSTGPGNTRPSKASPGRPRPSAAATDESPSADLTGLTPEAAGPDPVDPVAADPVAADPDPADPVQVALPAVEPAAESAAAEQAAATETVPLPEPDLGGGTEESPVGDDGGDHSGSPLPGYDSLTLAELRGHLRRLSAEQVTELVVRERAGAARAPFLTLLENRLTSIEHDGS